MSEKLRRYVLLRLKDEFVFFFPLFYLFSIFFSFLRYKDKLNFENVFTGLKLVSAFSIYVLPFTLFFSFFVSVFFALREMKEKLKYLEIFGLSDLKVFRFIFLLSLLFFSLSIYFAFVVSPKAFSFAEKNLTSALKPKKIKYLEFIAWKKKVIFAKKIVVGENKINAENGFLFDGEKTLSFEKISITVATSDSRFGKDLVDLIEEEGERGKREVVYTISVFSSILSCSPLFSSPVYLVCNPSLVLISKLFRDSLSLGKFAILSPLLHISVIILSVVLIRRRKFEK